MCEPTTLAGAALGLNAVGGVLGFQAGQTNADVANAYKAQQSAANQKTAVAAAQNTASALAIRNRQSRDRATRELNELLERSARSASLAKLGAAEGGVEGTTVDTLLRDFAQQEAELAGNISTQQDFVTEGLAIDAAANQATLEGRFQSTTFATDPGPSFLGTLLEVGGTSLSILGQTSGLDNEGNFKLFADFQT